MVSVASFGRLTQRRLGAPKLLKLQVSRQHEWYRYQEVIVVSVASFGRLTQRRLGAPKLPKLQVSGQHEWHSTIKQPW